MFKFHTGASTLEWVVIGAIVVSILGVAVYGIVSVAAGKYLDIRQALQ